MGRLIRFRLGLRPKIALWTAAVLILAIVALVETAHVISDRWTDRLGTDLARQLALRYADHFNATLAHEIAVARMMEGSPIVRAWLADGDRDPDLRQAALSELDRMGAESRGRQPVATLLRPGDRYRRYTNLHEEGIDTVVNIAELPRNEISAWFWEVREAFERAQDRRDHVSVHEEMPRNVMKVWINVPYRSGASVPALISIADVFSAIDLQAADAPFGHRAMLVDGTGHVRLHPEAGMIDRSAGELYGLDPGGLAALLEALPGSGRAVASVVGGRRWFLGVAPVDNTNLALLVALPDDGSVRSQMFLPMAGAVVGSVFVLWTIIHFGLGKMLLDPLSLMRKAADRRALGELAVRVPEGRSDELGQLAAAFNVMAEKLDQHTHDLESLVAERTADALRERDRADDALRRERAALARYKQFASLVSHEFRNPLAVIKSKSQLMELIAAQGGPPEERPWDAINRSVGRLQTLFEQWLTSETLAEGEFPFLAERMELAPFLDDVLALVPKSPLHRFELVPVSDGLTVEADPALIRVALINLLDNAVKYSPEGGTITLRAASSGERVSIQVIDHGLGIAPEDQARVFERHVRIRSDSGPPGMGLGLFMVREIARLHGGEVTLESVSGGGSTFTLSLPRSSGDA